jgi:hypothetical protein
MNTQEFTNKQQDIDSEFVEIVDRNFWEMISPLTENPKSVTHEVVIPDRGSSGKLDPKPCVYPNQPQNFNQCPYCKQIINTPSYTNTNKHGTF